MKSKLLFVLAFYFISVTGFSLVKDTTKFKHLSIGFRTGKDLYSELKDPVPAKLILSIDPVKYFRIDFQYGMYKEKRDYQGTGWGSSGSYTTTLNPEFKANSIAFGGYGMYNFDKTRIYLGYRFGRLKYTEDIVYNANTSTGSVPTIGTDNSITKTNSLIIGGEHFIVKRFSLGAEFGLNKAKETYTSYQPGAVPRIATSTYSEASIILRFYII